MTAPTNPEPTSNVLPLHAAVGVGVVRRGPGRPRRAKAAPSIDALAYRDAMLAALDEHIEADPVVRSAEDVRDDGTQLAWTLLTAMARECASLAFDVNNMPFGSREQERARSARVAGLIAVAKLRMEIAKLERGEVTQQMIAQVSVHLLSKVAAITRETLPAEDAERFLAHLSGGWMTTGTQCP